MINIARPFKALKAGIAYSAYSSSLEQSTTISALAAMAASIPASTVSKQYLFYQLAAFFSGMVGSQSLSKFLEQLSSAFSLMLAMTAGGAFLLLVSLLIAMMMVVTV